MEESTIERITTTVHNLAPQEFLRSNSNLEKNCLELLKLIYDLTKGVEKRSPLLQLSLSKKKLKLSKTEAPLESLITKNFDENQIWEEIQLQNNFTYETLVSSTSTLLAHQNIKVNQYDDGRLSNSESDEEETGKFQTDSEDDSEDDQTNDNGDLEKIKDEDEDSDSDSDKGDKNDEEEKPETLLDELDMEDKDEEDLEDSDEKRKKLKIPELDEINEIKDEEESLEMDDDDDDDLDGPEDEIEEPKEEPSNLDKRIRRLDQEIEEMESEALEPKSWQFQGEVTAKSRPENSLLEEHLIFDHLIRQAPEITLETTQRLEDIIKQRIKDGAFDDVIRKIKPIDDHLNFRKTLMLNAEKSKLSLAQIYEQEFIDQKKNEEVKEYKEPEEKTVEEHEIIKKDMKSLFAKLDALSNFHFTPRPASSELKIVTNLPALTIEEVAPINISEAAMLAPHEIEAPIQRSLKGKDERSDTDRKRERRLKKKKQHNKRIVQEEKLKAKGIPTQSVSFVNKNKPVKKSEGDRIGKELKTSTSFFATLQEQVQGKIKEKLKKKESKSLKGQPSAKRFKL